MNSFMEAIFENAYFHNPSGYSGIRDKSFALLVRLSNVRKYQKLPAKSP